MPISPIDKAFQLPFFAPESRLPAPLPSAEAIEKSEETLQEQTGRRIVRLGNSYIVKYGLNVSLTEGENMLLIREIGSIPIPEVFALYSITNADGRSVNYIIMENIVGQRLDTIWIRLCSSEKKEIASQLRSYFNILKNIPAPNYFGCIGRRPFEDSLFWTSPEDDIDHTAISGPFDTEIQLNNAFIQKYIYNTGLEHKAAYYRRVLPLVLHNNRSVFTHGDLQRKNVIMKDDGTAVLMDWETAGWYPEYWEYALATFACGRWSDDWHEYIAYTLAEYPNEYAWFEMIRREIWS